MITTTTVAIITTNLTVTSATSPRPTVVKKICGVYEFHTKAVDVPKW